MIITALLCLWKALVLVAAAQWYGHSQTFELGVWPHSGSGSSMDLGHPTAQPPMPLSTSEIRQILGRSSDADLGAFPLLCSHWKSPTWPSVFPSLPQDGNICFMTQQLPKVGSAQWFQEKALLWPQLRQFPLLGSPHYYSLSVVLSDPPCLTYFLKDIF